MSKHVYPVVLFGVFLAADTISPIGQISLCNTATGAINAFIREREQYNRDVEDIAGLAPSIGILKVPDAGLVLKIHTGLDVDELAEMTRQTKSDLAKIGEAHKEIILQD